jgi:hypothetical protein
VPDKLMSEEKHEKKHCSKKATGSRVKQIDSENKPPKDDDDTTPKKNMIS